MARRLFDLLFASLWLVLLAPVMLVIAILVRLDSPGPILYTPHMVGHQGRLFRLRRFRTMFTDRHDAGDPDERLTRVGRFLRTYSLDHLPMLLNLLDGSLTLVGPRPMEPDVVELRDPIWQRYFRVKPGLLNYAVLRLGSRWTSSRSSRPMLNQDLELAYIARQS
jgi:lipopolysaccharide/colanic/teichoic acid biosynthesis glycosyltransferase